MVIELDLYTNDFRVDLNFNLLTWKYLLFNTISKV